MHIIMWVSLAYVAGIATWWVVDFFAENDEPFTIKSEIDTYFLHRLEAAERNNERLLYALRDILDEQNGPPLINREEQWQKAHDEGYALLRELEYRGGK